MFLENLLDFWDQAHGRGLATISDMSEIIVPTLDALSDTVCSCQVLKCVMDKCCLSSSLADVLSPPSSQLWQSLRCANHPGDPE